jgi:hypothetical protein
MANNNTCGVSIDELVDFISFSSVHDTIDNAIGAAEHKQREKYKNGGEVPFYKVFQDILDKLNTEEHCHIYNELSDAVGEYNRFNCEISYKQGIFIGLKLYSLIRRLQDEGVL